MCPNSREKRESETAREEARDTAKKRGEGEKESGENTHSCAVGTKQKFPERPPLKS